MSSKDSHLYNPRTHNLTNGKEISSSTTLSFTSQLSSLINGPSTTTSNSKTSTRLKPKKDDLFRRPKGNAVKRAKRDHDDSPVFEQKHTTDGEKLDAGMWERSQRRMEEKARLYAAMKRGDLEDEEEKYAVDFDRKWAENPGAEDAEDSDDDEESDHELTEYTDEFGRTRKGTRAEIARAQRVANAQTAISSDRFTARPSAPSNIIHGDTIQHQAFNPDGDVMQQMDELARKRDKSLTPPPESHFDASKEVRNKGTGFFQFSADEEERRRQMAGLEEERSETEKKRNERQSKLDERKRQIEERRKEIQSKRGKRKADDFLDELGVELGEKVEGGRTGTEVTDRIEAAVAGEDDEGKDRGG